MRKIEILSHNKVLLSKAKQNSKVLKMTLHVSLPKELENLVHAEVSSGLYQSASEVVREALRSFFAARPLFDPEQTKWIRQEIGARLDAVENETVPLISADVVFDDLKKQAYTDTEIRSGFIR